MEKTIAMRRHSKRDATVTAASDVVVLAKGRVAESQLPPSLLSTVTSGKITENTKTVLRLTPGVCQRIVESLESAVAYDSERASQSFMVSGGADRRRSSTGTLVADGVGFPFDPPPSESMVCAQLKEIAQW